MPIITGIHFEGLGEKFQVTTSSGRTSKKDERDATKDNDGVSLETLKAAIKDKSDLVEQLKRTESNREALFVAQQDLRKTNELAQQLEAKQKKKPVTGKADVINFHNDFFHCQSYLTVSGRLHLESYASALGHVYSFGPRFQAGKTGSSKLVAEMWMVETEMAFAELEVRFLHFNVQHHVNDSANQKLVYTLLSSCVTIFLDFNFISGVPGCDEVCGRLLQVPLQVDARQLSRRYEICYETSGQVHC